MLLIGVGMVMAGKTWSWQRQLFKEILIKNPSLGWSSHIQRHESKDILSKQQMANHRTTNVT